MLQKHKNPDTGHEEWALVSKESGKPLKYFGQTKPHPNRVEHEEKRIQYFKNKEKFQKDHPGKKFPSK